MPDRENDPPRPPEGRSRKEAGPEREPCKDEDRCERRHEERRELALPAGLGGRGETLAGAGRYRRERTGRQYHPRRRAGGRAPARCAGGARRFPGGRRLRRREGGSLRGGTDGRRGHARDTGAAGCGACGMRGRGERDRCVALRRHGVERRSRKGRHRNRRRYADGGQHGRDGVADDLGRRGYGRRRRYGRSRSGSGLRRWSRSLRRQCDRRCRSGRCKRLVDGRPHRRAGAGRDGIHLREGRVDLRLRVGESRRRARGARDRRARQRAADGCGQHTCPT